jgi:hypothetical protein
VVSIRQIVLSVVLLLCAHTATAEIIQISAVARHSLRFETSATRIATGPRTTNREGSAVTSKPSSVAANGSNTTNTSGAQVAEKNSYSPSIGDAIIGLLVLLLAVGAAGGLARAQRPPVSRW